ncbi:chemotaxis protein CheA [Spirulina subsalsa]|uniref:chemotaxis protein CheA n=1 Tax=Spirulina subsalsa TaxID=54311 RepID=UPI00223850EA|nr:chemotaxis protein CheA [Spirulina subsalsa]
MSKTSEDNSFFTEFLEDYFAECEEHLAAIRQNLLALESFLNQPTVEPEVLQALFRSFHTLKGLSGMVGIKEAEALAHQMESYLRLLREEHPPLSASGFDALMEGTKTLEQVINCQHQNAPLPNIEPVVGQLKALLPPEIPPSQKGIITPIHLELPSAAQDHLKGAKEKGQQVWHFVFSPNSQRAQAGINVNVIRSRLEQLGQVIHAAPRLNSDHQIVFDFVVTTTAAESVFAPWSQDGVTWNPYETDRESLNPLETAVTTVKDSAETEPAKAATPVPEVEDTSPAPLLSTVDSPPALPLEPMTQPAPLISQPSTVVRVELPKLDALMRMVGDLVISRARLDDYIHQLTNSLPSAQLRPLQELNLTLERQMRDLREGVMRVRLVPIGEIFARMQFVVRDLVREIDKEVVLKISGQETEIDKFVVERMMDPLLHLVRNAVSHGIEGREQRVAAQKDPVGQIHLRARTSGEMVVIEIEDDGQGVDGKKVMGQAKARQLVSTGGGEDHYDGMTLLDILCTPGFSTKEQVDLTSGRGVGMAIVKNTVRELGGLLDLTTEVGQGTCFRIQLPLTLAIADALITNVGSETFAIPQSSVREVIEVPPSQIIHFENNEIISYRGQVLPLVHLSQLFHIAKSLDPIHPDTRLKIVVAGSSLNTVGLVVERIIGLREIVVQALTDPLVRVLGVAGATELGDGRVVLILDVSALVRMAAARKSISQGNRE